MNNENNIEFGEGTVLQTAPRLVVKQDGTVYKFLTKSELTHEPRVSETLHEAMCQFCDDLYRVTGVKLVVNRYEGFEYFVTTNFVDGTPLCNLSKDLWLEPFFKILN